MHRYLRAVGFSKIQKREEYEELVTFASECYQTEETGRGGLALVQYSYTGKAPTLKLTWEDSQLSPNRTRTFTDEQGRTMREAEFRRTASVPLNSTLKITCTCPAGSDVSVYQLGAVLI